MAYLGPEYRLVVVVSVVGTRRPVTFTPVNCDAFGRLPGIVPPALAYWPMPMAIACRTP
jgi:hypothetical protein